MSNRITPEERKLRTKELRLKHQIVFDSLNVPDPIFVPKMAYKEPLAGGQLVMGFFESELSACTDIYTEMVSFNMDPEDPIRTLYKYRANPHFRSEYLNKPTSGGDDRFLVPVSELIEVKRDTSGIGMVVSPYTPHITDPTTAYHHVLNPDDMLVSEMTVKDLATLLTGKPLSNKSWINDLVVSKSTSRTRK